MGCRGPSTYNSCSTFKWNNGVSWPVGSGHGCIGCSENNFWDNGPFYERLSGIPVPGIESTADRIGKTAAVAAGVGVAAHFASFAVRRARDKAKQSRAHERDADKG
jgi:hydrogenase small subunit